MTIKGISLPTSSCITSSRRSLALASARALQVNSSVKYRSLSLLSLSSSTRAPYTNITNNINNNNNNKSIINIIRHMSNTSSTSGTSHAPKVPNESVSGSWSSNSDPAYTRTTDHATNEASTRSPPPFDTVSGSMSSEMRQKTGNAPSSSPWSTSSKLSSSAGNESSACPSSSVCGASRSGAHESVWQTSFPATSEHVASFGPLTGHATTDIVIVGAGITGLTTAYELTRRGRDVIVVDGMTQIGGGETIRTSAHLASYIDDGITELKRLHGVEKTRLIVESHARAIDRIEAIVKRHNIHCDFARVDGFLLPQKVGSKTKDGEANEDNIQQEWNAIKECGVYPEAEFLDRVPSIEGLNTGKSIRFPNQGQFHPAKYLYQLSKILTEEKNDASNNSSATSSQEGKIGRCRIYCGTQIIKYEGGSKAFVETKDHCRVNANHIVMASNVPLQLIELIDSVEPMRTYVIGAPIPKEYAQKCSALWWDNGDPYHYVRIMKNDAAKGDDQYIMIIGGEDHVVGRDHGKSGPDRYRALEEWARERWPMMGQTTIRWSGQVEEPVDCVAYIGLNPHDNDNVYIVTGDSGMGLTHGTIAGELITDLITKKSSKYAAVYDPKRLPLRAAPGYMAQNIITQFQFGRWLAPSEISDIEDLKPCSGAVIREGLAPVAVYRDNKGQVHKMTAVCPHLKGIVRWNNDEQSWDCPVHGSRFTATGTVVHGPAKEGLAART